MEPEDLKGLVNEMREDFQIPLYFPDGQLERCAREGLEALGNLNPVADISADQQYRMLLKNYMYYAIHHITNEFFLNYSQLILKWQLESEVPDA